MEHRCGYRRSLHLRIIVRAINGVAADGQLCDISASGALVRTSLPVPGIGGHVLVHLGNRATASSAARRPVRAQVVRYVPDGFAVEWDEFSPQAVRDTLRRLDQLEAPDALVSAVRKKAV